ncbi:MAG: hypothetical protein ACREOO_31445 [bacterium]
MKPLDKREHHRRHAKPQQQLPRINREGQFHHKQWEKQHTEQAASAKTNNWEALDGETIEIKLGPALSDPEPARNDSADRSANLDKEIDELKRLQQETPLEVAVLAKELAEIREMLGNYAETAKAEMESLKQRQLHSEERIQNLATDFNLMEAKLEEKLVFTVEHLQKAIDRMLPGAKKTPGETKPASSLAKAPSAAPKATEQLLENPRTTSPAPATDAEDRMDKLILRLKSRDQNNRNIRCDQPFDLDFVFELPGFDFSGGARLRYYVTFYAKCLSSRKREIIAEVQDNIWSMSALAVKARAKALPASMYRLEAAFTLHLPGKEARPLVILVDCGLLQALG